MKTAYSGAAEMAEIIHPPRWRMGMTTVLKAYLDASSDERGAVHVVGGFVASTDAWKSFEALWLPFLSKNGLRRFHASPFWSRKAEFFTWSDAQHGDAVAEICEIFRQTKLMGVVKGVAADALEEWRHAQSFFYPEDPYHFALDRVLKLLIRGISEAPSDEGVMIYSDNEGGVRPRLGQQLADWHEERLRQPRSWRVGLNQQRQVNVCYGSNSDYVPLQAADILAHGSFCQMRDFLKSGEWGEPNAFLKAMNESGPVWSTFLYDAELVDFEFRSRLTTSEEG